MVCRNRKGETMTIPTLKCDIPTWLTTHPNDGRLEVRTPTELIDAIQKLADDNGWDFSYATRYLIVHGLRRCQPHQK